MREILRKSLSSSRTVISAMQLWLKCDKLSGKYAQALPRKKIVVERSRSLLALVFNTINVLDDRARYVYIYLLASLGYLHEHFHSPDGSDEFR